MPQAEICRLMRRRGWVRGDLVLPRLRLVLLQLNTCSRSLDCGVGCRSTVTISDSVSLLGIFVLDRINDLGPAQKSSSKSRKNNTLFVVGEPWHSSSKQSWMQLDVHEKAYSVRQFLEVRRANLLHPHGSVRHDFELHYGLSNSGNPNSTQYASWIQIGVAPVVISPASQTCNRYWARTGPWSTFQVGICEHVTPEQHQSRKFR